jgi:hypothetical protein
VKPNEYLTESGDIVFQHACKMGLEGIVIEAAGIALLVWAFSRLAEIQEPGSACCEAGGGGGLVTLTSTSASCCLRCVTSATATGSHSVRRIRLLVRAIGRVFISGDQ